MGNNLEEFKLMERIKVSYLKNRGQAVAIADDLGLDLSYVKRMVDKFKKKDSRETKFWIAETILGHIMTGHHQRITHLDEMLRSLDNMEQPLLSICCSNPVRKYPDSDRYECLFHHVPCEVQRVNMLSVYKLKIKLLDQIGAEEERLVGMAQKMGYVGGDEVPQQPAQVIKAQQNILVIPGQSESDKKVIADYTKLSPMDRDRLIDALQAQITGEPERFAPKGDSGNEREGADTVSRNESE